MIMNAVEKKRILIADDHTMFVDGIESILSEVPSLKVVGRCYDGPSVIDFFKESKVDLVLLDINLPGMSGIEVCKIVKEEYPHTKVLAISMFNDYSFIAEILDNGAEGYILKNTGSEELTMAINTILDGNTYFSKEVTEMIMKGLMKKRKGSGYSATNIPKISRREKEVLALIIDEYTTQEIADKLFISLKTVESHRSSLLSKLNARNTAGMVRVAMESNLLEK